MKLKIYKTSIKWLIIKIINKKIKNWSWDTNNEDSQSIILKGKKREKKKTEGPPVINWITNDYMHRTTKKRTQRNF